MHCILVSRIDTGSAERTTTRVAGRSQRPWYTAGMSLDPENSTVCRNVELKVRVASLDAIRPHVQSLASDRLCDQHQIDIYFCTPHGRLKLRNIMGRESQLIWYSRPDQPGSKTSHYVIARVGDPEGLESALRRAYGVRCTVDKHREIYLFENVRIHLDAVDKLGSFLEFEAVLEPGLDAEHGHQQLDDLRHQLSVSNHDLIPGSYVDLIEGDAGSSQQITSGSAVTSK